jgi:hypothetical protein
MMKLSRYRFHVLLSVVAFSMCSLQGQAAEMADVMHFSDDYPACSFSVIDAKTSKPVKNVFALAEWYKDVSVMEYATMPCRENYRLRSDETVFSIPAARCSGFRHGTALEIRVKALGYQMKKYRILRRPKSSHLIPHIAYLSIKDCGKVVQQLPLEKIKSIDEALEQYQDRYNRGQIASLFGNTEAYHEQIILELRSFDPSLHAAEAKKSYCGVVLKNIPKNTNRAKLIELTEPYCKDQKLD